MGESQWWRGTLLPLLPLHRQQFPHAACSIVDPVVFRRRRGAGLTLKNFDDFTAIDLAASVECLRLVRKATGVSVA
jgi:hypothetical protein